MKHAGTFISGLIFVVLGGLFLLEALGVWDLSLGDFWLLGPLVLMVIGIIVVVTSLTRGARGESE